MYTSGCVDPLNDGLQVIRTVQATHDELQPHMKGWSTYEHHSQPRPPRATNYDFVAPRTQGEQ